MSLRELWRQAVEQSRHVPINTRARPTPLPDAPENCKLVVPKHQWAAFVDASWRNRSMPPADQIGVEFAFQFTTELHNWLLSKQFTPTIERK